MSSTPPPHDGSSLSPPQGTPSDQVSTPPDGDSLASHGDAPPPTLPRGGLLPSTSSRGGAPSSTSSRGGAPPPTPSRGGVAPSTASRGGVASSTPSRGGLPSSIHSRSGAPPLTPIDTDFSSSATSSANPVATQTPSTVSTQLVPVGSAPPPRLLTSDLLANRPVAPMLIGPPYPIDKLPAITGGLTTNFHWCAADFELKPGTPVPSATAAFFEPNPAAHSAKCVAFHVPREQRLM